MTYAYLRVSTDEQDCANQRLGVAALAKRYGLTIDEEVQDNGVSGTKEPSKRHLGGLLKKLQPGDVILVSEISRLGRTLFMVMRILEGLMTRGVKLYSHKDGFELADNIQSKVLAFAFGLAAEIERTMISQRTKEALARRRAEGVTLGRPIGRVNASVKLSGCDERISRLFRRGLPQCRVAKRLGVHRTTLAKYLRERYIDPFPAPRRDATSHGTTTTGDTP